LASTGKKVNHIYHAGLPAARVAMAKRFAELGGFGRFFASHIHNPEVEWNAAHASIFLRAMQDVSTCVVDIDGFV
jgi:hypothetical protein